MRRVFLLATILTFCACQKLTQMASEEPTREQQGKALLVRGRSSFESGEYETAQRLFEQAAGLAPNDPEVSLFLGKIYAKLGNDGQAILSLKRAADLNSGDSEARMLLGDLYLHSGRIDLATAMLRKAAQNEEGAKDPELQRKLATALLRGQNPDEAEKVIDAVDKEHPNDPETLALYAEILIARGQEERAVELLDAAVAKNADSARVRTARARYFYSRGKVNEALREFEIAVKAAPDDMELAMSRARALASAQKYDEASKAMEEVVSARPTDLNAQASLAEVKLLAGDTAGAEGIADGVIARQPKNGRALYVRARAIELQSGGDLVRAINAYREVIEADPSQAEALGRLWPLYLKRGLKPDAITSLEHLLMLGESDARTELELATLYAETGINASRGLKMVEAQLKRDPENARLLKLKKDLQAKVGKSNTSPVGGGSGRVQVMKGRGIK